MLFLNRKGYAPLKICTNCGYRFKCQSCDSWLVEHKKTGRLICHHCDFKMPNVTTCPSCKEENKFVSYGPGVERIEEEVQKNFPQARIALITSDETKNLNKIKEISKIGKNPENSKNPKKNEVRPDIVRISKFE